MKSKLLFLSAFMFATVSCGGDDDTSSDSTTSPTTGDTTEVTDTTEPTDTGAPATDPPAVDYDPTATLSWIASVDPNTFDPHKLAISAYSTHLAPIFDSLTYRNSDLVIEPMLAESWELSEDGTELNLKLIEGWSFHDGTPFNAEAVVANLDRAQNNPESTVATSLTSVVSIEAADEYNVKIVTEGSAVPLLSVLSGPTGMMMSPAVFDDPTQDLNPTGGSGAFRLVRYAAADKAVYEPVENYWDPDAVKVGMLEIWVGSDEVKYNSVSAGTASATFIRPNQVPQAESDPNVVLLETPTINTYTIRLNTERSEFASKEVRQAMNHAVNREAVNAVLNGRCAPGVQMLPQSYWAGNPDIGGDFYAYDPDRARELLAEAGLPDGFSWTLELSNLPIFIQIAELLQQDFAAVGIDMEIVPVDLSVGLENFAVTKVSDGFFTEQRGESDPSVMVGNYFLAEGFMNPGGFEAEGVRELHEQALGLGTEAERAEFYHELQAIVVDEAAPNITLCTLTTSVIHGPNVQGMNVWPDTTRGLRGVSIAS